MSVVVDASVAFKWFSAQPDTDKAMALLGRDEPLLAPDLIVPEVCNAAWMAVRLTAMTEVQADTIPSRLARALSVMHSSIELAPRAMAIARSLDHAVYDCFYIALAEHSDSVLVTADSKLVRRCRDSKWKHRLVSLSEHATSGAEQPRR